jgi:hypothetical protein
MSIYGSCPKLQYLTLGCQQITADILATLNYGLGKRLKELASLKNGELGGKYFRLGTHHYDELVERLVCPFFFLTIDSKFCSRRRKPFLPSSTNRVD